MPEMIGNLVAGLFCEDYRRPVRMNRGQCRGSQRTGVITRYWQRQRKRVKGWVVTGALIESRAGWEEYDQKIT